VNYTKRELLEYFREGSEDTYEKLSISNLTNQQKTARMGNQMDFLKGEIIQQIQRTYQDNNEKVKRIFIIVYCWIVVSLERRNSLWPYNSIDLSRRSGELWETLIKVAWEYPINQDVSIFGAPSFIEVANWIQTSYKDALESAPLSECKRDELYDKYLRVWDILGEDIKLDSDQLFETPDTKYIVDFKGSYGSNEKGNKDRLLSVA
jgi:hypothetical protein